MGIYTQVDDVADRYEENLPSDRRDWVEVRIEDAEFALIGLVPSLASPTVVDVVRAAQVKRLICDKVLALFRNPDGALTIATEMGPERESRTLPGSRVAATSWVSFTADELAAVGATSTAGSVSSVLLKAYE